MRFQRVSRKNQSRMKSQLLPIFSIQANHFLRNCLYSHDERLTSYEVHHSRKCHFYRISAVIVTTKATIPSGMFLDSSGRSSETAKAHRG
eukprot:TRINITY_DN6477_c0_g1_i1.p1 TRINITY_DN6477_c0_g1~~TRINITY_DN6477_c0_g1_i1.p1  ORF type:complete len:90 (+),score=12.15 TRINITY_DN6477_c0_g1_i1:230-499(+)